MSGRGLVAGPTTGNVGGGTGSNFGPLIDDLQRQIIQKHPLIGTGELPQQSVNLLIDDLADKATKGELAAQIVTREPALTDGSVPQSRVDGLTQTLASLQTAINETATGEIPDGSIEIAKIATLRAELDGKATDAELAAGLALKEPLLVGEAVPQAKIAGLTAKLAALQAAVDAPNVIADSSLSIAQTDQLQEELNARVTDAELAAGLATREPTLVDESVPQSRITGLTARLADMQTAIDDGAASTNIDDVSGLQSALDGKASTTALSVKVGKSQYDKTEDNEV